MNNIKKGHPETRFVYPISLSIQIWFKKDFLFDILWMRRIRETPDQKKRVNFLFCYSIFKKGGGKSLIKDLSISKFLHADFLKN